MYSRIKFIGLIVLSITVFSCGSDDTSVVEVGVVNPQTPVEENSDNGTEVTTDPEPTQETPAEDNTPVEEDPMVNVPAGPRPAPIPSFVNTLNESNIRNIGVDDNFENCGVFVEENYFLVFEAENTQSDLGSWVVKTDVAGFRGSGHLEFTDPFDNDRTEMPEREISYRFRIQNAGNYRLMMRARKPGDDDKDNDVFIRMEGDFTVGQPGIVGAGTGANIRNLTRNSKMFGGNKPEPRDPANPRAFEIGEWGFAFNLDIGNPKQTAYYNFKAGETYTLILSGRSSFFDIDRIFMFEVSKMGFNGALTRSLALDQNPCE